MLWVIAAAMLLVMCLHGFLVASTDHSWYEVKESRQLAEYQSSVAIEPSDFAHCNWSPTRLERKQRAVNAGRTRKKARLGSSGG